MLWIVFTLIAAAAQTARNATQRSLTDSIGMVAATQVRFLFGLPFALLFLLLLGIFQHAVPPTPGLDSLLYTTGGALSQIVATGLMLRAMQEKSFGVTTAMIKTEPILTALVGWAVLGDSLTLLKVIGILIATGGVLLLSFKPGSAAGLRSQLRPACLGLAAGGLFGLSAVLFRGGILALPSGDFVMRATTILALGLLIQVAVLLLMLLLFNRKALLDSLQKWRPSLGAGCLGALASQFWFLGFALTSAANVRTLALVEVFMAQAVQRRLFSEGTSPRDLAGMALIVMGVALVLLAAL